MVHGSCDISLGPRGISHSGQYNTRNVYDVALVDKHPDPLIIFSFFVYFYLKESMTHNKTVDKMKFTTVIRAIEIEHVAKWEYPLTIFKVKCKYNPSSDILLSFLSHCQLF